MCFPILATVLLLTVTASSSDEISSKPQPTPFQDWDYIVYSQRWPVTACSQWKERNANNTCTLPQDTNTWTVHGVWPTKIGANGPFYCDSALHFDPQQLEPMMKELQEFWPNIEANTKPDSFWKHEWSKHGTCASTLPELDSVTNFFRQGLDWNQGFKLSELLSKSDIVPNVQGYNVSFVYDSIQGTLGKNPIVECVVDGKSKQSLISEIRICFNKSLDLIDCNVEKDGVGDILSNCNAKENVMYLAKVPEVLDGFGGVEGPSIGGCIDDGYFQRNLLRLYGIIKFLMWITL